jgi:hypothetical protein
MMGELRNADRGHPREYPPIWRQSHPADEVLSSAQNSVIGAAMTRTHAEMSNSSARISTHEVEYSLTLSRPGRQSP